MAELEMSLELDFEIEDFEEENEKLNRLKQIDLSTLKLRNIQSVSITRH